MKAVIFRPTQLEGHKSWRPRSLVDLRGPIFPEEYYEFLVLLDAQSIADAFDQYQSKLGDIVFMGEGEEVLSYVAAPFGWEMVKFGQEWRSSE